MAMYDLNYYEEMILAEAGDPEPVKSSIFVAADTLSRLKR